MRKLNRILNSSILLLLTIFVAVSCNKDKESEGHYGITYYADIEIEGDRTVILLPGDEYEELGASATENGVEIDVAISGEVDTETPGVYQIAYTAMNSDGFPKTEYRTIFVLLGTPPEDFSFVGTYTVPDRGFSSTITEVVPGLYRTTDIFGWSAANKCPSYILTDGEEIYVPYTSTPYGGLDGGGEYDSETSTMTVHVTLYDQSGVPTITRNWIKQ